MKAPEFLFIETTTECNLRCRQCHMWLSTEPDDSLTTAEKVDVIEAFASWAPNATLVLTGGETMRKREEFFALSRAARCAGLSVAANTNATQIDADTIDRLLTEGPHYLVISLDSHDAGVHDWIRGRAGTFDAVVAAIRALLERRRALPDHGVKVMTNSILFDRNVADIEALVGFLCDLGVDGIMFQALSRTFWNQQEHGDVFFDTHLPRDVEGFDRAIDAIARLRDAGAPIVTPANDLAWMKRYVREPDFIGEQVCASGERNMMLDQRGDVQLCFSMRGLMGGRALGNVREQSLRALWESRDAAAARAVMADCRKNCGMLNCHRRIT